MKNPQHISDILKELYLDKQVKKYNMKTELEIRSLMIECSENMLSCIEEMNTSKAVRNKPNEARARKRAETWKQKLGWYQFCINAINSMDAQNLMRQYNELLVKMKTAHDRAFNQIWSETKVKPDLQNPAIKARMKELLKAYKYDTWKKELKILQFILK